MGEGLQAAKHPSGTERQGVDHAEAVVDRVLGGVTVLGGVAEEREKLTRCASTSVVIQNRSPFCGALPAPIRRSSATLATSVN